MKLENQNRLQSLLSIVVLCAACMIIAGCNTIEGAGRDIEAAGDGIQDAAD